MDIFCETACKYKALCYNSPNERGVEAMLKTALIGLGRIGWNSHRLKILETEGYALCAVVDTCQERLDEAKALHGVNGYTDYKEMLAAEKPDVVVIASPTVFHEEQAVGCMEAGVDVILDKPMSVDYPSALRIAEAQKRTGRKLIVFQPYRCNPIVGMAKEIIKSGKLGRIYKMHGFQGGFERRNDWQSFRKYGGGMLSNYGAHQVDYMLHLAQSKVKESFCVTQRVLSIGDAEDVAHMLIYMENDILLQIDISGAAAIPEIPFAIYGDCGAAEVRVDEKGQQYYYLKYHDPSTLEEKTASESLAAENRAYCRDNFQWVEEEIPLTADLWLDFYKECLPYFNGTGPSFIPLEETVQVMALLQQFHDKCDR